MQMKRPGETAGCDPTLITRLIEFFETELIPATKQAVEKGHKVFGGGMLRKSDLSTIVLGTNNETENPLWHGEVHTIKRYYGMVNADATRQIDPKEVIFVTSHEPCPP